VKAAIRTRVNSTLYPGTVLSGLHGVAIILTSPLDQFLETGDINKREMVERSSNDVEAPVVALL
jgi:hypothetical protein